MNAQGLRLPLDGGKRDGNSNVANANAPSERSATNASGKPAPVAPPSSATTGPVGTTSAKSLPPVPSTPSASSAGNGDWLSAPKDLLRGDWAFPSRDWSVGDTWSDSQLVAWNSIAEALRLTANYRYVGAEKIDENVRLDKIEVAMVWEDLTPTDTISNMSIDRQRGVGTIYFDSAAGHLVSSERDQQLVVTLIDPEGQPNQIEVTTRINLRFQPIEIEGRSELEVTDEP